MQWLRLVDTLIHVPSVYFVDILQQVTVNITVKFTDNNMIFRSELPFTVTYCIDLLQSVAVNTTVKYC